MTSGAICALCTLSAVPSSTRARRQPAPGSVPQRKLATEPRGAPGKLRGGWWEQMMCAKRGCKKNGALNSVWRAASWHLVPATRHPPPAERLPDSLPQAHQKPACTLPPRR